MPDLLLMKPAQIPEKLSHGEIRISTVGLGWMGLPTACLFAEAGAVVIGVDTNPAIVERINSGETHFEEPGLPQMLRRNVKNARIKATTSIAEGCAQADAVVVLVPATSDTRKKADYSAIESVCRELGKVLQKNSLVLIESTCGPGVTEKLFRGILEKNSGLKAGEDFGLAYSPIRAMSGTTLTDLQNYPRIVGGIDKRSLEVASALLSTIVKGEILKVQNLRTAEAVKIFEAVYRDVNIALANEMAVFCQNIHIDYIEAMRAANTQPYSHLHLPSVGVGGHCLPTYPYLLLTEASNSETRMKLVKDARVLNEEMPKICLKNIADGLRACGKSLKRGRIALLGITFRPNLKELRASPALELANLLKRRGARLIVYDPLFSATEIEKLGFKAEPNLKSSINRADCVVIAVGHDDLKALEPKELAAAMSRSAVIVDCTHSMDPMAVEKTGLYYRGVGRGVWTR